SILTAKFWYLILTQINPFVDRSLLRNGCRLLEFILKVCLYLNNWLNACVALERSMAVHTGAYFNKSRSKSIARKVIIIVPIVIMLSIVHELVFRDLFEDHEEQRLWCLMSYSRSIHTYNTIVSLFHFLGPFLANFYSAVFITFRGAQQRARVQPQITQRQHRWQQLNDYKHLIISSIVLVILTIPQLIISSLSGCVKAAYQSPVYAAGYFISFVPSMSIFVVFVLPSRLYQSQFKKALKSWRQMFSRR
ncbi:unnamed protein product, partial [Adineta ricciae]